MDVHASLERKVEYLYYDLGNVSTSAASPLRSSRSPLIGIRQQTTRFNGNIVRAGVNFTSTGALPRLWRKY
ncbi:MAG: hypothetical protein FD139_3652 [Methylocystaceae bacterium]|nr:MAG: hypothetical protein FD148_363 [Methylocystaceae bacterium]KAF0209742.1 MAG: hypothetical protein FD172_3192 [Methylocystaceae bacterium]TXT42376.1 MAG: hypothetical protein FD139_3652 [Methylocystaceae bacterium]